MQQINTKANLEEIKLVRFAIHVLYLVYGVNALLSIPIFIFAISSFAPDHYLTVDTLQLKSFQALLYAILYMAMTIAGAVSYNYFFLFIKNITKYADVFLLKNVIFFKKAVVWMFFMNVFIFLVEAYKSWCYIAADKNMEFSYSFTGIIFTLILYMIAKAFEAGARLKEDQDLTV
ncbi:MAG: hypothetical protein WCJ58_01420 [bacterium]